MQVIKTGESLCTQILYSAVDSDIVLEMRYCADNTWSKWIQIPSLKYLNTVLQDYKKREEFAILTGYITANTSGQVLSYPFRLQ